MKLEQYIDLKDAIISAGYEKEVDWAESVKVCDNSTDFFLEFGWVVVNSGMKNQIALKIWEKILIAIQDGKTIASAFGHEGKSAAIQYVLDNRWGLYEGYIAATDKLEYLKFLPWIGDITKYHLAKNLGEDHCKPDRHLTRIAKSFGTTPDLLCQGLANQTGDRIGTVDLVIWRAANLGLV